ncbi:MAG: hypothetical protein JO368_07130 [Acidimicrobiales bacterium]|nr:hypothetical protein [Acidimicrobiales bacterium]
MTPSSPATARRGEARAPRRTAPEAASRPTLRVLERKRRQRRPRRRLARPELLVAGSLVVGSLLAVVVGDAVVAQGQIRMTHTQQAIAAATATEKAEQVAVAEQAAPPVVVRGAERLGLVAPASIVDLPTVPLNVPLPAPIVTPTSSAPPQ